MDLIPFGNYQPDISDFQSSGALYALNVVPRADGYGPFPAFSSYSSAMAGACRGFFKAIKSDGSIAIFAATSTKIYLLDNSALTWTDVSKGSSTYTAIPSSDQWQFVQFNNFVIAVQINTVPQVFDLTSSTNFADLGGSPPQSKYIWVTNRFVFLGGISGFPYRIQWSGLNATTTWTSGTNQSDYQDFADGGLVLGGAGGEYGVVFQQTAIRRITYAPGAPYIFQIDRISDDRGLLCPYSIVRSGDKVFYFGQSGFSKIEPGSFPISVGDERVNRTVLADFDAANKQLFMGVSDPKYNRVMWAYKSANGTSGLFDKIIVYNYVLDRWSPISVSGEFVGSMAQPGVTLEGLDTISASIDALPQSLDDYAASAIPEIAAVNSSHVLGFFRGTPLEATMETAQQAGNDRVFVNQMVAVTDAPTVYGSLGTRNRLADAETFSAESAMDSIGQIPLRTGGKYARGRIRIPAGTSWSFATGVQADFQEDGDR
jgi:hypothetical protein